MIPASVEATRQALEAQHYIAEKSLAVSVFLSLQLQRPLLLEGEPGVGKTEIVKVLARLLNAPLIRLQCYEGLDLAHAVYEWDYARQMMQIRLGEAAGQHDASLLRQQIYHPDFLLRRPLLQALEATQHQPAVLLIDELDRADEEFEAYLLEFLSDWQVTIPELGTLRAQHPPVVVLTSNRTREIHDALKRRCLYHWIDYPSFDKELRILQQKVPGLAPGLAAQLVALVQALRQQDLYKSPGVAETLDWAAALMALGAVQLDEAVLLDTLGVLLKYQDDLLKIRTQARDLLAGMQLTSLP